MVVVGGRGDRKGMQMVSLRYKDWYNFNGKSADVCFFPDTNMVAGSG